MTLLPPILLGLLASLIGGLYLLGGFRQRQPGEPPLDKGLIPWLGHGLEYRKDKMKFLERMRQKHGNVFTVQLGGYFITFLMDPFIFGAFVKESRERLDFNKYAIQLVHQLFGYKASGNERQMITKSSHNHLMGPGLEILTLSMMTNLQSLLLKNVVPSSVQKTWIEDNLYNYSYNIIFRAGYLSLFGNASHQSEGSLEKAKEKDISESEALYYKFCTFDRFIPNFAFGGLKREKKREAETVRAFFWNALSIQKLKTRDNVSKWVCDMHQAIMDMGINESMVDRLMLVLLWVSQANTGPTAFWLLFFIMKHPEAMAAVKGEVDQVLKESGQKVLHGGPLIDLTCEMLKKMPILDSAVDETLRLTATPTLIRAVSQDMTLNMADGCKCLVRKGDRLALFPYMVVQTDPEIHPDPHSFKYDRFFNPDGSKKTDFYKAGKKVKYYNMPWGAGVSMCPGRFFANNELKQFIFLMLVYFEIELKNPHDEVPDTDLNRKGFGVNHPLKDMPFQYRPRF
ncbi:5-beta-cholestane-3-alpha,7-alpha-diol 12-alpha-hydroxylase-like [Trematomus bernacchii]|uniref:5-beta-cholestane-3-alpha,7-alpha-diol 12-alpha-hydroxylase-like n=1 Tax=Trematomus bernacchii TaxID=40690 RepID=UPI00146AD21A|nr:5-beta-cholestane-3-alpha,7-alpha-diol 12-alpha-hydroxylase-like [Trematomus bernacchii]